MLPTRTVYTFEGGGVALTLTFLTPALPDDLDVLSRARDLSDVRIPSDGRQVARRAAVLRRLGRIGREHARPAGHGSRGTGIGELVAVKIGSKEQPVLAKSGDDMRIDWGYLYVAAARVGVAGSGLAERQAMQSGFVPDGLRIAAGAVSRCRPCAVPGSGRGL